MQPHHQPPPPPTTTTLATLTLALAAASLTPLNSHAQLAEFSLRGSIDSATTEQPIPFTLSREVTAAEATNPDTIKFLTLHHSGGINHAGAMIPSGSFDADLELRDSTNALIAFNEDSGLGSDARLNFAIGSPPIPAPIGPGDFTLHITKFPTSDDGPWALDIQAPADAMILTLPGAIGPAPGNPGVSDVAVLRPGATWNVLGDLKVGDQGTGTLFINDQAAVTNTTGFIAHSPGSTGTASVQVNATWTNTAGLYVGGTDTAPGGTATLNVHSGGNLNVTGTLKLWEPTDTLNHSGGTITVNNGTFDPLPAAGDYSIDGPNNPTIALNNSTFDIGAGFLRVGDTDSGTLTINNNAIVSNARGFIGNMTGSTGTVTVDNATWTNSGSLYVGSEGTGTLTIKNGANVSNTVGIIGTFTGSTGTVTVDNATWTNSSSLFVGLQGTGILTITNGAEVSNESAEIGNSTGSTGTGTVTVDNASWTNAGDLAIGGEGTGTLNIENGANVSNGFASIGNSTGSTGTVTVDNATWTNAGDLAIGGEGTGTLNIENGANVSNGFASIGNSTGSTGTVTVDNATWTNTGILDIGNSGTGTLTIKNGADVSNGVVSIGNSTGSTGTVTVDGGTWTTVDSFVGDSGTGELTIASGGSVISNIVVIGSNPDGTGTVMVQEGTWMIEHRLLIGMGGTGSLTIESGGIVSNIGQVSITHSDSSTGTATVNGGTWNSASYFDIGTSSSAPTRTGILNVNAGNLNVTGTLKRWQTTDTLNHTGGTITVIDGSFEPLPAGGDYSIDGPDNPTLALNNSTFDVGTDNLFVGNADSGALNIGPGAIMSNHTARVGFSADASGTATIDGGTWNNASQLVIASFGTGAMTIDNGGYVSSSVEALIATQVGSSGTATVNDGATWTSDGTMHAGFRGQGTLTINTGGTVSNHFGTIATKDTATGQVSVNGGTWTNTGQLTVGNSGTGSMTINAGGNVTNTLGGFIGAQTGSTGTATINDGGTWTNTGQLRVGNSGTGSLTINTGGTVSNTNGWVGNDATGNGNVSINGGTWTNTGELAVGRSGNGSMTINNSGNVTNALPGSIATNTGATGSVTVNDGGTWTNDVGLFIGFHGQGSLTINAGGTVTNSNALLGFHPGSDATVTVQGPGAAWNNNSIFVGGSGVAPGGPSTLTVKDIAQVNATQTLKIWNTGRVDLAGGAITAQQIDNTDAGTFNWFSGTVNITSPSGLTLSPDNIGTNIVVDTNSALNVTNTLTVPTSAVLNIAGGDLNVGAAQVQPAATMIAANTTINLGAGLTNQSNLTLIDTTVNGPVTSPAGSAINVIGTVTFNDLVSGAAGFFGSGTAVFNAGHNPGDSPAAVNIEGNLTYTPTNTLYIELAGPTPGTQHDQLNISGGVTLDGTLDIQPLDAYTPTLGDTFTILNYATRTSDTYFDTITNTLIDTTLALAPLLDDTTSQLTLRATIPGDLNLDNKVSVADLSTFALNFNTNPGLYDDATNTNSWQLGDFNTDGAITVADLSLLALNFGFDAADPTTSPTPLSLTQIAALAGIDTTSIPEPTTAASLLIAMTTLAASRRTSQQN